MTALVQTARDPGLWFRLLLCAIAVAIGSAVTWQVRGVIAERERTEAVEQAISAMQQELDAERARRQTYQKLADETLATILDKVSNIKVESKNITNNITKEVERNPLFYGQLIPEGGKQQWTATRNLINRTLADGDSPSSPYSLLPAAPTP